MSETTHNVPRIIQITVHPDGRTQLQTSGILGSGCQEVSRFLEEALGKRLSQEKTPEFFQTQPQCEQQRQGV